VFGYVVAEFAVCVIADDGTSSSSMLIVDAPDARPYTATALEISKAPAVVSVNPQDQESLPQALVSSIFTAAVIVPQALRPSDHILFLRSSPF